MATHTRPAYIQVTTSPPPNDESNGGGAALFSRLYPRKLKAGHRQAATVQSPISPLAVLPQQHGKKLNIYQRHGRTMSASIDDTQMQSTDSSNSYSGAGPVRQRHTAGGQGDGSAGHSPKIGRRTSLLDGIRDLFLVFDHRDRPRGGSASNADQSAQQARKRVVMKLRKAGKLTNSEATSTSRMDTSDVRVRVHRASTESGDDEVVSLDGDMKSPGAFSEMIEQKSTNRLFAEDYDEFDKDDFFDFGNPAFERPRSKSTDLLVVRKTSRPMIVEVVGTIDKVSDPYRQYLEKLSCYELAPHTGYVIILDNRLTVHKSFLTLIDTKDQYAVVWDEKQARLQGALSKSDFVEMLYEFSKTIEQQTENNPEKHQETGNGNNNGGSAEAVNLNLDSVHMKPLSWWMERKQADGAGALLAVGSEQKLFHALIRLQRHRIQRMPVFEKHDYPQKVPDQLEPSDMLYLISLSRILRSMYKQTKLVRLLPWFLKRLSDIQLGTWSEDLVVVHDSTLLKDAIEAFVTRRLSSLPVLQEDGHPYEILNKTDILHLLTAAPTDKSPSDAYKQLLSSTVYDAIQAKLIRNEREREKSASKAGGGASVNIETKTTKDSGFCSPQSTVLAVLERMAVYRHECVFVVDDTDRMTLLAAVSASDLMRYVVMDRVRHKVSCIHERTSDEQQQLLIEQFEANHVK